MNSVTQPTEPPAAATALRACADLAETAVCLARLAGTAAQADFCGVFLLDYTGTELLLRAVWHAGAGASAPRGHSLPLGSQDPVCFSLQTGTEYTVRDGMQNAAFPSLDLLRPQKAAARLTALPLPAWKNRSLGGLLLGVIETFARAYISTELSTAIVFGVLIIVLLVKPAGLLGKTVREKV